MELVELVGLGLALFVLILASFVVNCVFGHVTFHRPSKRLRQQQQYSNTPTPPPYPFSPPVQSSPPPPPPPLLLHASAVPDQLQTRLPQHLLASDVLSFLRPYEVIQLLQTCRSLRQVGELPSFWQQAMVRSGLLRPDEDDEMLLKSPTRRKMMYEYFRRMFLSPHQLSKGHDTPESCRVIIHGKVYDVTSFLSTHPGGEYVLMEHGGCVDATMVFELSYHSAQARDMMKAYLLYDPAVHVGRAGTILGLFKLVSSSLSPSSSASANKATSSSSSSSSPLSSLSSSLPWAWDDRRRLRPGEDRSPPKIVERIEALQF